MTNAVSLPPQNDVRIQMAITLMNQGFAQLRSNDPAQVAAAVQSYEQAIAIFRSLPASDHPEVVNSHAAAWMNHGQLLHRLHGTVQATTALNSFEQAVSLLRSLDLDANPWPRRNLAGTILNRACLQMDLKEPRAALESAREALPLVVPTETTEPVDADLAIKLRRVACDAIGQLLVASSREEQFNLASEASDYVDDGLAIARTWEDRGEKAFIPLALRLFYFGAQLYRLHQPHFLAEFLSEELDRPSVSDTARIIARENVEIALKTARPPEAFLTVGSPASERYAQTVRELEALRDRLAT